MASQCRGWRDAEDVIEAIGATPIENLGPAIVAVGPCSRISVLGQCERGSRATGALRKGLISLPLGRLAGRSTAVTKRLFAVEHDDRLKSVFVVVGVEQPQLLTTVETASNVSSMSSVIRLGTVAKDSQYRSTIALPIRSTARTSGRFSNRDIVDCEHNSRSMGERSSAILNIGSTRRPLASLPSS